MMKPLKIKTKSREKIIAKMDKKFAENLSCFFDVIDIYDYTEAMGLLREEIDSFKNFRNMLEKELENG